MIWKTIPLFPDYRVSENGDVERQTDAPTRKAGTRLTPSPDKDGYLGVSLSNGVLRRRVRISRLVCSVFNGGDLDTTMHAAHGDGNIGNNHYSNLRWASAKENCSDKLKHGSQQKGESVYNAKLTEETVRFIRSSNLKARELAEKYQVALATIYAARQGRLWRHVL